MSEAQNTPTTHSRIGASSMHRWAVCPGSIRESEGLPGTQSDYAVEGTTAHDLAAAKILGQDTTRFMIEVTDPEDPRFVDDEMLEAVEVYVTAFNEAKEGAKFYKVEQTFDLSSLHPGLFGTSDGIIYHEDKLELEVWDYKHGAGLPVDVEHNEQLMYYGLGALLESKVKCKTVKLVIVQPRCPHSDGPIRSWTISTTDLIDFSADLVDAAKRTEDPNAPLVPGSHCKFCRASAICPKLSEQALATAKEDFSVIVSDQKYDPEKLASYLEAVPVIEAWVKSVKQFAFNEAEAGKSIPGFKLVPKRANRKWRDEALAEQSLALELGLEESSMYKPRSLRSVAQVESALTSKEDKKFLESLVIKESSGNTLVPITDKREAVKSAVEVDFKKIPQDESLSGNEVQENILT